MSEKEFQARYGTPDDRTLARILSLLDEPETWWDEQDLRAMLAHQLSCPIAEDAARLDGAVNLRVEELCRSMNPPARTGAELIAHAQPNLELLQMMKDLAKSRAASAERVLPSALYVIVELLTVCAAWQKLGIRITTAPDTSVVEVLDWAIGCAWIDPAHRQTFTQLRERLTANNEHR